MSKYDINKLFPNYPYDAIDSFNSFMTPDLQKALLDLTSVASDFSGAISAEALSQFADFSRHSGINALFNELSDCMNSIFTPELSSVLSNIANGASDLSDIVKSSSDAFSSLAEYNMSNDSDDYVILNETPIRKLNVPDEVAITVGHNRVRMSTTTFIAIISLIFATFIGIGSFIADRIDSSNSSEDTAQLLEYERDQTFYLREIFNSLDASNSLQKEFLEDTRSVFQSTQDEVQDTSLESTDNSRE